MAWHLLTWTVVVGWFVGRRPSTRLVAFVTIGSFVSVSVLSWSAGNPFNGIVFAVLVAALALATVRTRGGDIQFGRPARAVPGAILLVFGWTYPHFLLTESWTEYVYAAPFGVIPCPTLSAAIGATLLIRNLGTTAWKVILILSGLLYGAVGTFSLAVRLDAILLGGTLVLAVATASDRRHFRSMRDRARVGAVHAVR